MKKAYGITPASVTCWNSDESFNQKEMEKYIRWMLDNGAQSISVCGSTGENIAMETDEQKKIIEACTKFIAGEVPVYAGTGRYSTAQTIDLSVFAEKVGCDGVMTILPYYLFPNKPSVLQHFRNVRKHISIDIMVYNNPMFAGYELNADEVATLYNEGVISSIKCAHGDPHRIAEVKYTCGDGLTAFYGHDYGGLEAYAGGADGWLSAWPAIFPWHCRAVQDAILMDKDVEKGRKLMMDFMPMTKLFFDDKINGVPHWQDFMHYALELQGINSGLPRLPAGGQLTDEYKAKMKKVLSNVSYK